MAELEISSIISAKVVDATSTTNSKDKDISYVTHICACEEDNPHKKNPAYINILNNLEKQ